MLMENKKLAIAIPTYKRGSILKENIELMLGEIRMYSIPIYVSDDSNDDSTKSIFEEFQNDYEYIRYYKNKPGLGHDKNCLRTLALPTAEYIWYLGDSIIIKPGGIKKVLDIIESGNYDFISVNGDNRNVDCPAGIFEDGNLLLVEIGWHLTMTGATIYSNRIQALTKVLDLNICKNFPQTALIFESFAQDKSKLFWTDQRLIYGNKNKKSYWNNAVFDVFLIDWFFFISNLPKNYLDKNKKHTIKKHNLKTGLFTLMRILDYRSQGIYSFQILRKYFQQIRFSSHVNIVLLLLISVAPKGLLNYFKQFFYPGR
jgi:hypothetical protein